MNRRSFLRFSLLASTTVLGGCATGNDVTGSADGMPMSGIAADPTLLVATTRLPVKQAKETPFFGTQRSDVAAFAKVELQIPESGITARAYNAVAGGDWSVKSVALTDGPGAQTMAQAVTGRDVLFYIHGFKETFESAVFSAATLSNDIRWIGKTALFAWPSKAGLLDYGYDRESALVSRDALGDVLEALAHTPTGGKIHIVAHSMGTLLTLETIRQLAAVSGDQFAGRFGAIVLASPDIDLDLFASTVSRIGAYGEKITVITATDDRALALSRRLAGGVDRVGAANSDVLERLGVKVVDASALGWGVVRHDLFLTNAQVRGAIRAAIDAEA